MITLGLLLAAGLGAYVFATQYGFRAPDDEVSASPTVPADAGEAVGDDRPEWLADSNRDLPPTLAGQDEREPQAHLMVDWVWDFVDDDWDLLLVREGDGDGITYLNDLQALFLVSPDGEHFRLFSNLRQDFNIAVLHWDPKLALAWLVRGGRPGVDQVVQFDLRTGESDESWYGNAVASVNAVPGGVGRVAFLGDQPDGRELWGSYDSDGAATGLFWRSPANVFEGSIMNNEIRRLRQQGFSDNRGVDAWVSADSMTAVYRATFRIDGKVEEERWILHNLVNDDFRTVKPKVPSGADCRAPGDLLSTGQFDGDRIVARCTSGNSSETVLIDPTGESGPT
jgi:hypothetical protein